MPLGDNEKANIELNLLDQVYNFGWLDSFESIRPDVAIASK